VGQWAVVIPSERYEAERLVHHDSLDLTELLGERGRPGDQVLVAADGRPPRLVGAGVIGPGGALRYTRRALDQPPVADGLPTGPGATALDRERFEALAGRLAPPPDDRTWLVSLDLPIEAPTEAEAVRRFWAYVTALGPRELPVFVSPTGDELAMTAYVTGAPTNLDPEEDGEA
jgi:hypothetical protein